MKRILLLLPLLAFCAGCASPYNITLNNGDVITSRGKPTFDRARYGYFYTDDTGNPAFVPMGRVREIQPKSWGNQSDSKSFEFLPTPGAH